MRGLWLFLLSTIATIAFAVARDQILIRASPDYFSIGHPHVIASASPTLHALYWGVVSSWWIGVTFGLVLVCITRFREPAPKLRDLLLVLVVSLIAAFALALIAGGIVQGFIALLGIGFEAMLSGLHGSQPASSQPRKPDALAFAWVFDHASIVTLTVTLLAVCTAAIMRRLASQRSPAIQSQATSD